MRRLLSDDHYFGKKSYVTAFCESDSRPKLPSQAANVGKKLDFSSAGNGSAAGSKNLSGSGAVGSYLDDNESSFMSSPKKMLNRLRDAASLAI